MTAERISIRLWDYRDTDALQELRAVLAIAKAHRRTLGFLPNAAFTHSGGHGGLLLAVAAGQVIGYLLFDLQQRAQAVKVVHVCVDETARERGLGVRLVQAAAAAAPHAKSMTARCRKDYGLDRFWRACGLTPRGERAGRALAGSTLIIWWRALGQLDLFEAALAAPDRRFAVLDTNVVSDLYAHNGSLRPLADISSGLLAGWIEPLIDFAVSSQVDFELASIPDATERKVQRESAQHLTRLRPSVDLSLQKALLVHLSDLASHDRSVEADVIHLCDAIAAGAEFFVTNDAALLRATQPWIGPDFGLRTVRPDALIASLRRGAESSSGGRLLESMAFKWQPVDAVSEEQVENAFVSQGRERGADFRHDLRAGVATGVSDLLLDESSRPWALVGGQTVSTSDSRATYEVQQARVLRGQYAGAMAGQIVRTLRRRAAHHGCVAVVVRDRFPGPQVEQALHVDGFERRESGWWAEVDAAVRPLGSLTSRERGDLPSSANDVRTLERRRWPTVIIEGPVPTLMVPIQPRHADRLLGFTPGVLWQQRKRELGLAREQVYFHGPGGASVPESVARLLWYVTADDTLQVRQVVARSWLVESTTMPAEVAHARFGIRGVLRRKDVLEAADKKGRVTVMRFEDTEMLARPLDRTDMRPLLTCHGVTGPLLTVRRVPGELFDDVMRLQPSVIAADI